MPNLFGLDIARLVDDSLSAAGGVLTGTLTKRTSGTRTPGSLTAGTNPTETSHAFRGFIASRTTSRRGGTAAETSGRFVTILGASISPAAVPEPSDRVTIEGETFDVLSVTRDPAAAVFECEVEA